MRFVNKILLSGGFSIAYFLSSLFVDLTPCLTAPRVISTKYSWGLCSLNPDIFSASGAQSLFWGISSSLRDAYLISLIGVFLVILLVLSVKLKRTKSKKEE